MLVIMIVSLYTTRVVLQALGIDDYGIYNVVGSIVVFFSFINAGLAGATKRYVLAELAVGDLKTQRKVYTLAIKAHLLIVGIVLLAGETIGLWMLYNAMNIPAERMHAASIVYQMSLFTAIVSILQSPFSSVIISYEKMSAYAFLSIFEVLVKLGIVFMIQYLLLDKLIMYSILLFCLSLITISLYYGYCRKKFEMCRIVKTGDKETFNSILKYVGWTVFGTGSNVLSKQGVTLLVNNFFNVAVNAAMGVSNMVINAASQFVSNLQIAFAPQLTRNYISKNFEDLELLVFRSSRYTSFLILIILIPLFFVISDMLAIWLGDYPQYTEEFCLLTLVSIYLEAISLPLTTVVTADKNIGKYQVAMSMAYILNFAISWIILLFFKIPYLVVVVRVVVDMFIVTLRMLFIKIKVRNFPILKWIITVIGNTLVISIVCLPLIPLSKLFSSQDIWTRFIVLSSICLIWVTLAIWLIGMSPNEKFFVIKRIKSVIRR